MLFSQGGLFSLKCLYQIHFDDNWFSEKPQHLNRSYTLQGYMLLVLNTHFKKDDVKIRLRYTYANITLNVHTVLVPFPTLVLVSLPLSQLRGIGLRNFNVVLAGMNSQDHFQYLSEGAGVYMAFEP